MTDVVATEVLNTEFQWINRQSDVMLKAESPQYGEFLILNSATKLFLILVEL